MKVIALDCRKLLKYEIYIFFIGCYESHKTKERRERKLRLEILPGASILEGAVVKIYNNNLSDYTFLVTDFFKAVI